MSYTTRQATRSRLAEDDAEAAHLSVRLLILTDALNLVPESAESGNPITDALDALASVGIARRSAAMGRAAPMGGAVGGAEVMREAVAAIEESPLPDHEWFPLGSLFGDEQLAKLVGTSVSSVHRYSLGERTTPDKVAARLHTIMLIVADLAGSYNQFGIRRWFQRPRTALDGAAPAEILTGDWSPDDARVAGVRDLARSLLGSPAT